MLWFGFGCQQQATSNADNPQIIHTIDRLSFGIAPGEAEQVRSQGVESYIQSQLNPQSLPEPSSLTSYIAGLDSLKKSPMELFEVVQLNLKKIRESDLSASEKEKLLKQNAKHKKHTREQSTNARLARAIMSPRQLQEVMVDFWFNHFNVYAAKNPVDYWIPNYENDIRTNALGSFRELLGATAHHPAMMIYLDNELNSDPDSARASKSSKYKGLNENYARELMELHTLGVDGGYTQDDVIALARIFTGWGRNHHDNERGEDNGFLFSPSRHVPGDKVLLGKTIKGGGMEEGEAALDLLASHPSTARFISFKLAQYFVADEPPTALVDRLAQTFMESRGSIKTLLDTLFHSPEFNDPQYYGKKYKTPYQYVLSLVRASGIKDPDYQRIHGMLLQLGMPIYRCQTPNGYKNTQEAWLNPDSMLRRISFASAIASGAASERQPIAVEQLETTLGETLSTDTKQVIAGSPNKLHSALMLGSPEMMYK
jgi:uncharacterized protein (DUF1800 family)